MEIQITKRIRWVTITETYMPYESWSIPADHDTATYPEGNVTREYREGYGVRESAPGYLDCTEWEVFDTLAEAERRAREIEEEYADAD